MEERRTVRALKKLNLSYRETTKQVKVSVSTVFFTIKRHLETRGKYGSKQFGLPKATTESEDKFRSEWFV